MEKFKVKVDDRYLIGFIGDHGIKTSGISGDAVIFSISTIEDFRNDIIARLLPNCIIEFIPVPDEKQPESNPKELDLCEILKNAPRGLKLWSVIYGEVKLSYTLSKSEDYSIFFDRGRTDSRGRHYANFKGGECTLFPSKDNRDWSTFKLPYKLPVKGELCWTMSSVGNWITRFAVGESAMNGKAFFFDDQDCEGTTSPYIWHPLSEIPEVLKNNLKLK